MKKNIKLNINYMYFYIGLFALLWTLWTIIHSISNFPKYHLYVSPGSISAKFMGRSNINQYFGDLTVFAYFTILSNLLFSFITFIRGFYRKNIFNLYSQISVTVYMLVTGIIFWTSLSYMLPWNDILFDVEQIVLHLINPILAISILVFIVRNKKNNLKIKKSILFTLSFPIFYYFMSWIFYLIVYGKVAVYPFLDFFHPFLYSGNYLLIFVIDILILTAMLGLFISLNFLMLFIIKNENLKWLKKS